MVIKNLLWSVTALTGLVAAGCGSKEGSGRSEEARPEATLMEASAALQAIGIVQLERYPSDGQQVLVALIGEDGEQLGYVEAFATADQRSAAIELEGQLIVMDISEKELAVHTNDDILRFRTDSEFSNNVPSGMEQHFLVLEELSLAIQNADQVPYTFCAWGGWEVTNATPRREWYGSYCACEKHTRYGWFFGWCVTWSPWKELRRYDATYNNGDCRTSCNWGI
jgi:hypothetical protein